MIKTRTFVLAVAFSLVGCESKEGGSNTTVAAPQPASAAEVAAYESAKPLLQQNCLICHSTKPAMPGYRVAPAGVVLETPEQLRRFAPRVLAMVELQQMPPLNMTSMSSDDRRRLAATVRTQWP